MTLLIGAITIGLIYSLVALGVYVSSRILAFRDLTVDGSFVLGACVTAVLLRGGWEPDVESHWHPYFGAVMHALRNPFLATAAGFVAGFAAGAVTGILATKFKINGLIAGILVMTALFTVNLRVMGRSNLSLVQTSSLVTVAERGGTAITGSMTDVSFLGWPVHPRDLATLVFSIVTAVAFGWVLRWFLRGELGTSMRATGENAQMVTALGVSVDVMIVLGLALSNGLIGLSGAIFAQYQGFADVGMGVGTLVFGLASVIIGEALVRTTKVGWMISGTIVGAILFRQLLALALRLGLDPNDLKLLMALFLFFALVLPDFLGYLRKKL